MHSLRDVTILITGAAGGIGQKLARALHDQGAKLILTDVNADKLTELNVSLGEKHYDFVADVSKKTQRQSLVGYCQNLPYPVQMIINLAGINRFAAITDYSDDDIERMLTINLSSQIALTRDFIPLLEKNAPSSIVNVGSILGSIGMPGYSVYCATKFGLRGFSEALHRELAGSGVDVRYFAPRATRTALNDDNVNEMNKALGSAVDSPERVANAIVDFLLTDKRRHYFGWPEKLFVKINSILPGIVDKSIIKQLPIIKRYF